MSPASPDFRPGSKVNHAELGEGVVVGISQSGYISVFFRSCGERQVTPDSIKPGLDHFDQITAAFSSVSSRSPEKLCLAIEAEELPLMESAATLTSAKVDLLPHQVVLVHRIANANPRRFLIADEVGLGKTIETALILRELASRGELTRAMMVVPAGLVENWRRELNDVFNLDFEVFGSDGDVTDRKTNAFAKHNRLIVSIDTLKLRPRIKKLLDAPQWDLVVFDEAHHLSVYRVGKRAKKTENFKLAEVLRNLCRNMLLLSATPHQGDHFRFWMLIRLLIPELFRSEEDMLENRYRLNAVVIRRTKADACTSDGSPLFARRMVHTRGFELSETEKQFYNQLIQYLGDGYNLASMQGKKGRALGFIMTIFQKIAASSFAAIQSTLKRRLLMLTIQEVIERDELLDVDGRNAVLEEAREIIHDLYNLPYDTVGNADADRILSQSRVQMLKRKKNIADYVTKAESFSDSEITADTDEESAAMLASFSLPEERVRVRKLLASVPPKPESKILVLTEALQQIWDQNPEEKVVIFATYLGTVDAIKKQLDLLFPGKGIDVLKGGDHGAKTAAQRRFKRKNGPKVLVCTAAGREGINLQFARILFNYDLPWNPMDLEQRIGRIHRYGQQSTAQVYNLVATNTIEGQIFLLLDQKLNDIVKALGKVDDQGEVAEDLRTQVLGQLSSTVSYDQLYQDALKDPALVRTKEELNVALSNANLARQVVFELFQDLDRFNIGDYKRFDDEGKGMQRLLDFVTRAVKHTGEVFRKEEEGRWVFQGTEGNSCFFTTDREQALTDDNLELLGLEHPVIKKILVTCTGFPAHNRAFFARAQNIPCPGLLSFWKISTQSKDGQSRQTITRIALTSNGERAPWLERLKFQNLIMDTDSSSGEYWKQVATAHKQLLHDLLLRELQYRGIISKEDSYAAELLGIVGIK